MRTDIQEGSSMTPSRSSASTHAASSSSSSSSKMVSTGTSMMGEHTFGDEVEVHSFLVIDQHTFEGTDYNAVCSVSVFVCIVDILAGFHLKSTYKSKFTKYF